MTLTLITREPALRADGDPRRTIAQRCNELLRAVNMNQLGRRNLLLNGAFDVWQRGTSFAISTIGTYHADRWASRSSGTSSTRNVSRQAGFAGSRYCMRIQRPNGSAGTGTFRLVEILPTEWAHLIAGKTVRLSFDLRAGADNTLATLTARLGTGTAEEETYDTNAQVFPTGADTETASINVPANGGAHQRVSAIFVVPAGIGEAASGFSTGVYSGTAGSNDYIEITNFQLEIVDATDQIATPFEVIPFAQTLAECQRFYEKSFVYATAPAQNVGVDTGETVFQAWAAGANAQRSHQIIFRRRKRAAPTMTLYNPAAASGEVRDETASANCTSSAAANASETGFRVTCTGNASTAIGNALGIHWAASAELPVS